VSQSNTHLWSPHVSSAEGPYKVLLKRGEFTDVNRNNDDGSIRVVPYKIYYPAEHNLDQMPLLIWSHGFGGSVEGAGFLSRYIASYGYTVAHITHRGTDSSLWEGQPGHPWDILKNIKVSRITTLNRFYDIPFALDSLENWAQENPDIGRFIDFASIGMSGHSFGALSTQVAAGQMYADDKEHLQHTPEPRIKSGILYSPVPVADHLLERIVDLGDTNIYSTINIPLLHMTGTDDASPIGDQPYTHRLKVFEDTLYPEKYLLIKQGGDHMTYNGTRGKLQANPLRERHEEIIKATSLAFWEKTLKQNSKATEWLDGDGVKEWLAADAVLKSGS
jgi:hypothetical protein